MPKVYVDAHGPQEREVKHHMLLPHEIVASLYAKGAMEACSALTVLLARYFVEIKKTSGQSYAQLRLENIGSNMPLRIGTRTTPFCVCFDCSSEAA